MNIYSRRTFLKDCALLSATAAAGQILLREVTATPRTVNQQRPVPPFFAQAPTLDVIAHRGGDGERPGETMHAFRHAVAIGADVLEMDVYQTIDGHLVLMHNPTVNETTDGTGLVSLRTLKKLKQLNAGFDWDKGDDNRQFYKKKLDEVPAGIRNDLSIPTLDEVFTAFPHKRMNIEIKLSTLSAVEKLGEAIREYNMEDKVLVASFWHFYLRKFRRLYPEVATSASVAELINYKLTNKRPDAFAIQITPEVALELRRRTLKVKLPLLTREFVEKAHADGLKVHAWTINDTEQMKRVRDLGVDGIITDYPTHLLTVRDQGNTAVT